MASEFMSNDELCSGAINNLPDVNFHASLNDTRILPEVGDVQHEGSIKLDPNVSVLEIHTLTATEGKIS